MRATFSTDLLLRVLQATPQELAVIECSSVSICGSLGGFFMLSVGLSIY
jgi:hypothetical protein